MPRNPIMRVLRTPMFKKRVERKLKGRASYTRKIKHARQGKET